MNPTENMEHPVSPRLPRRTAAIVVVTIGVLALLGAVLFAFLNGTEPQPVTDNFERYRPAWESAMRKAGVEATFPVGPVDLERVKRTGRQPFSATFTEDEVGALLAVYRYRSDSIRGDLEVEGISVAFPDDGFARVMTEVRVNGDSYRAQIEAPVTYSTNGLRIDESKANLSIEGFSVGGRQREEALQTVAEYLDAMLEAAPGLEVERAVIQKGGVRVEGVAPAMIEHPEPIPARSGAIAALSSG